MRGGFGGGSGGMIIRQASTLAIAASTAKIFASGDASDNPGGNGIDPTAPGDGCQPRVATGNAGTGGSRFPATRRNGASAINDDTPSGAGGGGGGASI